MPSNDFCFDEQLHHFKKNILEKIINDIDHGFKSQLITLTYLTQPSQIFSCNPDLDLIEKSFQFLVLLLFISIIICVGYARQKSSPANTKTNLTQPNLVIFPCFLGSISSMFYEQLLHAQIPKA